ncbi:MAG: hypothetical protein ACXWFY_03810, partial [Chthoniobacterales bacterium]
MPFSLREIAVGISAATLIFFCSCERHHPGETEGHAKSEPGKHEKSAESHPASSATAAPTPAQFFPES